MAADEFGDKTHEATPYRRQKAREEGQVVRSQDLASAALLIAGLIIVWYFTRSLAEFLGRLTQDQLGGAAWLSLDAQTASHHAAAVSARLSLSLLPLLA